MDAYNYWNFGFVICAYFVVVCLLWFWFWLCLLLFVVFVLLLAVWLFVSGVVFVL